MKNIKIPMYGKSDIDIEKIASKSLWKSGRFVKNLIINAHNRWLYEYLKNKDFVMNTDIILSCIDITKDESKNTDKIMWFKL